MSQNPLSLPQQRRFGSTSRTDAWWLQPIVVFLGLGAFVIYSTWAAFVGVDYFCAVGGAHYLSPFYSPLVFGASTEPSLLGARPAWMPLWVSPALLILWAPGGFRFTCYYYRGAYYKAFWGDPSNCAVGEPRSCYRGEASLPLTLQNVHRYFLYLALLFILILAWDAWKGMWFRDGDGLETWGIGVGTLVLMVNVVLLGGYTFGCHSLRHLVGGRLNILSRRPTRKKAYECVSCLNRGHMSWAWLSLFWVGFTDFYIRMCAIGVWTDWRVF